LEAERSRAASHGAWTTVALRFDLRQEGSVEGADNNASRATPEINEGPALWMEKCLETLSTWLRQVSPSSLAGTVGRFVPALLATASVIGLLDHESRPTVGERKVTRDFRRRD
jgi:hypothetical protein